MPLIVRAQIVLSGSGGQTFNISTNTTVTGAISNATDGITFNVTTPGVTITWDATIIGVEGFAGNDLNNVTLVDVVGVGSRFIVRTGLIEGTGRNINAIRSNGNIEINGGRVETAENGGGANAILATGVNSQVIISASGIVFAGGPNSRAIRTTGATSVIEINGGFVEAGLSVAIQTSGNITIGGEVSGFQGGIISEGVGRIVVVNSGSVGTTNGIAISANNNAVTINGGTTVGGSSPGGTAIHTTNTITVIGGAVSANGEGGTAIAVPANSAININGGVVSATGEGGTAISTSGNVTVRGSTTEVRAGAGIGINTSGIVRVEGGTVSATGEGGIAINSTNITANAVTVTGSAAIVRATDGIAINTTGAVTVGGANTVVSATTGRAIRTRGNVNVNSGGRVEATGNAGIAIDSASNVTVSGANAIVSATTGVAINATGNVTVGATGTNTPTGGRVQATTGIGINTVGNVHINTTDSVTVNTTSTLAADTRTAIIVRGQNSTVTVRSGIVGIHSPTSGSGRGISSIGTTGRRTITINGGIVRTASGNAILVDGTHTTINVENGMVSTTTAAAISMPWGTTFGNRRLNVSGGTIRSTGSNAVTIGGSTGATVIIDSVFITGGTIVSNATGSSTIIISPPVLVAVSGGTISQTNTNANVVNAISANAPNSTITVSGGTVRANGTGATINATGTGTVNPVAITVTGGIVRATTGAAIATGARRVEVSNRGVVFAHGDSIMGSGQWGGTTTSRARVIVANNRDNINISGTGMVIAWNPINRVYCPNTDIDLITEPPAATAVWSGRTGVTSTVDPGIRFTNGTNTGFIDTVTNLIPLVRLTTTRPIAANFTFSPDSVVYNCQQQHITITPLIPTNHSPLSPINPAIWHWVRYNGDTTRPINAGIYNISIDVLRVSNNSTYCPANNIPLTGTFTITPRVLTIVADTINMLQGTTPTWTELNPPSPQSVRYRFREGDDFITICNSDADLLRDLLEVYINNAGQDASTLPTGTYPGRVGVRWRSGVIPNPNYTLTFETGVLEVRNITDIARIEVTIGGVTSIATHDSVNEFSFIFVDFECNIYEATIRAFAVYPDDTEISIILSEGEAHPQYVDIPRTIDLDWGTNIFNIRIISIQDRISFSDYVLRIVRERRSADYLLQIEVTYDGTEKTVNIPRPDGTGLFPVFFDSVVVGDNPVSMELRRPIDAGMYNIRVEISAGCDLFVGTLIVLPRTLTVVAHDRTVACYTDLSLPILDGFTHSGFVFNDNEYIERVFTERPVVTIDPSINSSITGVYSGAVWVSGGVATNYVFHHIYGTLEVLCDGIVYVEVSANPPHGGIAVGGGRVIANFTEVSIVATPNDNWNFYNWTKDGVEFSTDASYLFLATDYYDLVANFTMNITVSANPTAGGSVFGGGAHSYNDNVTVRAIPHAGYSFSHWTENGLGVSDDAYYTFLATVPRDLVANFKFSITVSANPPSGGTVSGGGDYLYGTPVVISATTNTGYSFVDWTITTANGTTTSTEITQSFFATEVISFVANFEPKTYDIIVSADPQEGGSTTGGGQNIVHGTQVVVEATANTGWSFVNWTITNISGTTTSTNRIETFFATENITYIANFELNTYDIVVLANPTAYGTVSGGRTNLPHGTSVTVQAIVNTGFYFVNWTENGVQVSPSMIYSFIATDSRTLVANFSTRAHNITVSANPPTGGAASGGGVHAHGANVTVQATPNTGYNFINWAITTAENTTTSTDITVSFIAIEDISFVANFQAKTYDIVTLANPAEGGMVSGGGNDVVHGTQVIVEAVPNAGFDFVNWTVNDVPVSTNAVHLFEVTESIIFVANFTIRTYDISVSANPTEGGTVSGGKTNIAHGTLVTVTAIPNAGFRFVNWTITTATETTTSQNATKTFPATEDVAFVANFEFLTYDIILSANPPNAGIVTGGGTGITHFTEITAIATPNAGFDFINWTESGNVISSKTAYQFIAESGRNLVANFERQFFTITPSIATGMGTITPNAAITVQYGGHQTFGITPDYGWEISEIVVDGEVVTTTVSFTFNNVTANRTITVSFRPASHNISVSANPPTGGTVSGGGLIVRGETTTISASPNDGYNFINWRITTILGTTFSTETSKTFFVTEDAIYIANFERRTYDIFVSGSELGTVSGGGTFYHGDDVVLLASPFGSDCHQHQFIGWAIDGTIVSTDNPFIFEATENLSIVAVFDEHLLDFDTYAVTLWNNTFKLNLNRLRESGLEVIGNRWFKNGREQMNTRTIDEFSFSAGPNRNDLLELAPTYYRFQIITQNCGILSSTRKMMTVRYLVNERHADIELIAYPNPVLSGSPLTLVGTTAGSQIQIFNRSGLLKKTIVATDNTTTLTLSLPLGVYLIRTDNKAIQILVTQ